MSKHQPLSGAQESGRTASWASSLVIHLSFFALLALYVTPGNPQSSPLVIDTRFEADDTVLVDTPVAAAINTSPGPEGASAGSPMLFQELTHAQISAAPRISLSSNFDVSLVGTLTSSGLSEFVGPLSGGVGGGQLGNGTGQEGTGSGGGFFGIKADGKRVVFVVDSSRSMNHPHPGPGGTRFRRVQWELVNTLSRMKNDQHFFIIFFSNRAWPMPARALVPATDDAKQTFANWVAAVKSGGGTEPETALRLAVGMRPDAIYFLTDGQFDVGVVPIVTQLNQGHAAIHTIGFGDDMGAPLLQKIAMANRGRYRFIPSDEQIESPPADEPAVQPTAADQPITKITQDLSGPAD